MTYGRFSPLCPLSPLRPFCLLSLPTLVLQELLLALVGVECHFL